MNKVKCLIYCTKDKNNQLYRYYGNRYDVLESKQHTMPQPDFFMNGKVVAQFNCEKVDLIEAVKRENDKPFYISNTKIKSHWMFSDTGLNYEQLYDYLGDKNGYAIQISNLEIFDEPYNVDECNQYRKWNTRLKNSPQNMCEVYGKDGNHYVLISIKPEWVCKILNGEKTIEVRKKVLNCLKELI